MYNENVYVLFSHEGMKIIKNRVVEGKKKYIFLHGRVCRSLVNSLHTCLSKCLEMLLLHLSSVLKDVVLNPPG